MGEGGENLETELRGKPAISQIYTNFNFFDFGRFSTTYGNFQRSTEISALLSTLWMRGDIQKWTFNVDTQWLTANEAAQYLKIRPRTLLKWAKEGHIPAHALSGSKRVTWRFLRSELDSAMLKAPSAAGLGGSIEQQN